MVELVPEICNCFRVSNMSQSRQSDFIHLLFPTSDGIRERYDFPSMRLWLGGCLYAHNGESQTKCVAESILL